MQIAMTSGIAVNSNIAELMNSIITDEQYNYRAEGTVELQTQI